jgi:hypothetical protein
MKLFPMTNYPTSPTVHFFDLSFSQSIQRYLKFLTTYEQHCSRQKSSFFFDFRLFPEKAGSVKKMIQKHMVPG